jgi:hypothetical protein
MNIENHNSAIQAVVRTRDGLWHGSAVGIAKNFLERSGWARATVELPPGTRLADLTDLGAECLSRRDLERQPVPKNGRCAVHGFGRIFFLNEDYTPGARLPVTIPGWRFKVGEMRTVALK